MDLIAACVAVASLFLAAERFAPVPAPLDSQEIQTVTAQPDQANSLKDAKKTRHPLQMMANLGMASWYGAVLDGHRTASGEIFHKEEMTACHRTLPFGTLVRVVDVKSGKSVVVRINDRGVLFPDRIIDLSSGAADSLGILRSGVAKVRLEVLKRAARLDSTTNPPKPGDVTGQMAQPAPETQGETLASISDETPIS
jgi:rare lipoprotein A